MERDRKKVLFIIIGIFVGIFALVLIVVLMSPGPPEESKATEFLQEDAPVTIENGDELFAFLGEPRFAKFRVNLASIHKNRSSEQALVSFKIEKVTNKDEQKGSISLEGKFNDSSDIYVIQLTKQPNNQLAIKASVKGQEIDNSALPANSKRANYIITLPIDRTSYSIDYSAESDEFILQMFDDTEQNRAAAANELLTGLGVQSLEGVNYRFFYPTSYFRGEVSEPVE